MKKHLQIFKEELKKNGLKVTKSRISVFVILKKNDKVFLSPEDIFDKIKKSKLDQCDRTSVYRVLSSLEEIDLVKTSHFQGEASKYQLHLHNETCDHAHEVHEHYFKCIDCKSIDTIGSCLSEPKIIELNNLGYKTLSHHFEISGLCPNCNTQ
jgi:Fe2+ or Zn2+ uptake regulation protein